VVGAETSEGGEYKGVVMSIFIVFNLFSISFIFSKWSSPNRVRIEGRHRLHLKKGGAKSPSSKNDGKITIGLHCRGKITNLPSIFLA
jgi:hypothetical protein